MELGAVLTARSWQRSTSPPGFQLKQAWEEMPLAQSEGTHASPLTVWVKHCSSLQARSRAERGEGVGQQLVVVWWCKLTTLKDKKGNFWEQSHRFCRVWGGISHCPPAHPCSLFPLSALAHTPWQERPLKAFQLQHLVHLEIIKEGIRWISWSD